MSLLERNRQVAPTISNMAAEIAPVVPDVSQPVAGQIESVQPSPDSDQNQSVPKVADNRDALQPAKTVKATVPAQERVVKSESPWYQLYSRRRTDMARIKDTGRRPSGKLDKLTNLFSGFIASAQMFGQGLLSAPVVASVVAPIMTISRRIVHRIIDPEAESAGRLFVEANKHEGIASRILKGGSNLASYMMLSHGNSDRLVDVKTNTLGLKSVHQLENMLFDAASFDQFRRDILVASGDTRLTPSEGVKAGLDVVNECAGSVDDLLTHLAERHGNDRIYVDRLLSRMDEEVAHRERTRWLKGAIGKSVDSIFPAAFIAMSFDLVSGKYNQLIKSVWNKVTGAATTVGNGFGNWFHQSAVPAVEKSFDNFGTWLSNDAGPGLGNMASGLGTHVHNGFQFIGDGLRGLGDGIRWGVDELGKTLKVIPNP